MPLLPKEKKIQHQRRKYNISSFIISLGLILIAIATILILKIFSPVAIQEVKYQLRDKINSLKKIITPVDSQFGIVIPKIGANAKIIANVDPFNQKEYQWQLSKGVAHARGTVFPGQTGNSFIFAHSSGNWYEANRYNSIFYLLHKLVKGDSIYLFYNNKRFEYKVKETKIVEASEVKYLTGTGLKKTVTLMTCWPPGTTLKRYLVIAEAP